MRREFDFEQAVKRTIRQLKEQLQQYKSQLSYEFKTIEDKTEQKPVEVAQIRKLLTTPSEYVLVFHIEDTGLVHAVPLTEFVSLSPSNLRIHLPNLTLAPMPYFVYLNKDALEKISLPIAIVKQETIEKVVEEVEKKPHTSNLKPIDEFVRLVWKRYEQLVLASLLYNAIKQEELDN
jgi:phage-related protein